LDVVTHRALGQGRERAELVQGEGVFLHRINLTQRLFHLTVL
jgi:hypothetical protein